MLIGGVFVTLMGGVVILAYFILWLSMPPADTIPPDKFDLDDFREQ